MTHFTWCEPARGGAGGVVMPVARRSAEEYPGSTRGAPRCSPTVSVHWYLGGLHHAAQRPRPLLHPRPQYAPGAARGRGAAVTTSSPDRGALVEHVDDWRA